MTYIDDSLKLDLLWKKFQFGVSQTDPNKSPYEELTKTHDQIRASDIWQQDSSIPANASAVTGIVEFVDIRLREETSVTDGSAWVAVGVYGTGITPENRLKDFISPKFDPSYEIRVYSDSSKTQRIYNSAETTNWVFDYSSGLLWFPNFDGLRVVEEVYITGYRYVGPKGLNPTFAGDVIDVLTDLTDGNFEGGYIPGWEENKTRISDAIDQLNRALLDFLPKAPTMLSEMYLEMPGSITLIDDANVVLSTGFKNNTNGLSFIPSPGQGVEKVVGINLETNYVGPFGDGAKGVLSVNLNNASAGEVVLSLGDNSGIYGNLDLNQENATIGEYSTFYETLTARAVALNLPTGLNALKLNHTVTGQTNTLWLVRDSSNVKPTITAVTVEADENNQVVYSSGIPHFTRGSNFRVGASVQNLATDLHLDTKNVEFQTVPQAAGPTVWAFPNEFGLPNVLEKGSNYVVSGVPYNIEDYDGAVSHGTSVFKAIARNTNGKTEFTSTQRINFMRGGTSTGLGPVEEAAVPIHNLGVADPGFPLYASRILLPKGANPVANFVAGALPVWSSNEVLPPHEAAIVGGALTHTTEDYSTYLPAGPNYSTQESAQYATFVIKRKHVSQMLIEIEGRYSELYVKLLGLTGFTKTSQGWLDAMQAYEGWGVPGRDVGPGCAVGLPASGGSQSVHVTFGTQNSSNASDYTVLVRFRLNAGQAITGLRFSGVN